MTELEFEDHRDHLIGVAYRMLGSRAEAEDAVQDAWLRWQRSDRGAIADSRGWLTTVTARICLDTLRSARVRREAYVGAWLPEPIVTRMPDPHAVDPAEQAARTSDVSIALLTVLERLTPEQRVAFVLHDVFAVPFDEIANVVGGTAEAARQLASRARKAVREGQIRHSPDLAEQQRVLDAFVTAVNGGSLETLVKVLAPDVIMVGDGGGLAPAASRPVTGAVQVARFLLGLGRRFGADTVYEPVLVNGDLGLLGDTANPEGGPPLRLVMTFAIENGQVHGVFNMLNPLKLARVPRLDPVHRIQLAPPVG